MKSLPGRGHAFLALIGAGALGVLLSCNLPTNVGEGGLTVQVTSPQALIMTPGLDMTVSSYAISGTGPNGASFSKTITGSSGSFSGLALGTWNIAVDGSNAAGTIVSHGATSAVVSAGANQTVTITAAPVSGSGSLSLTVTWLAASVDIPSIQAQLVPNQGTAIDLAFSISTPGKATYSGAAIPTGYYTLVVKLLDNGQLVMGAVDVVRIVKGQTTSGSIDFTSVNTGTGSIIVNITPTINNPIPVTMSGQQATMSAGAPVTVTASVPSGLGTVTYVWYLNGASRTTGPSFTFNTAAAPLTPGVYRLDVAAFTAGGSQGGSATFTFTVTSASASRTYTTSFPLSEAPISENGNWICGGSVGLDWNNVMTTPGLAQGQGPSSASYSDPTALLTGTWGPNQTVQATVHSVNQTTSYYQEVELRLRSSLSAHQSTGYEINFRCLKNSSAYMQIVRWNGPRGDFTYIRSYSGAQYGVTEGDVVKASIVGSVITVSINGVVVGSGTDSTYSSGNPGIGFDYGCGTTYGDFGFTKVTASDSPF